MADLALGYSKTALDFVVNKVQTAKKEEEEQWQTVQRDLVFISGEFEMMQSFLNTADGERLKSLVVRTWVQQVRDLSYDVEDSIEFVLKLDFGKRPWWLRLVPSWMKAAPEAPVDEAVAEITQLKAQVVDVSKRNTRYNLITDSSAKPGGAFRILGASHINTNDDISDIFLCFNFFEQSLRVTCVLSEMVGDLGTFHFIRRLYDASNDQFSRSAWVKLMHPFNPHEFIRSLLAQFLRSSCEAKGEKILGVEVLTKMEEIQLINEFVDEVNKHKYFIVLEGVSSMEEWDAIKTYLPDRENGSRIFLWTHHVEIATHCTGVPYRAFVIRESSPDHPSYVFYRSDWEARIEVEAPKLLHGRRLETDELLKVLMDRNIRRIAVWGPPGVGKTALVKTLYDDVQRLGESDEGFAQQAWANVPNPLVDVVSVSRDIVSGMRKDGRNQKLYSDHCGGRDDVNACQILLKFSNGRTLVVVDGVRSKQDWDRINTDVTCVMQAGSCVVAITEDESVAAHCAGRSHVEHVLRVNPLGPAASLRLLIDTARIRDAVEECRPLSSKCGGLPAIIHTIGVHLFNTPREMEEMRFLNDHFIQQLHDNQRLNCLKYVLGWMHSKFDGSPTHLKKCIFYLSLFPRDSNIRRKRLVRRWIAEGYCSGTNINEEAENLIGKVRDLCLFQTWETVIPVPGSMSKTSCQVNYSFFDYIISRQTEEKTFLPLEISVLEGRCSPPANCVGQHLAIRSDWGRDKAATYISLDFSRLRSLTASGKWDPFFIPQKMRVLRVLDLEGTSNLEDDELDQIGELMPRLKYLSLRRCRPISRLPKSLDGLKLLETLDIKHTYITVLPETITKLQKLQHIRAGKTHWGSSGSSDVQVSATDERRPWQSWGSTLSDCLSKSLGCSVAGYRTGGVGVPRSMAGMKVLHTLGVVDIDMPGGKALLAELRKMKNKKMKNKNKKKGAESHPLRNLSLCGQDWSLHLLHCSSSQDQLESLSLRAENLQVEHFNLPPNVVKFSLDMAGILPQGVVDAIKHHGKLQTLRLHAKEVEGGNVCFFTAMKDGESVGGSFNEVKILEISCSSSFHAKFSGQGMQKLELMKVHCHRGSPSDISGLKQLGALKQVWLTGSCDVALKKALENQLSEHPNKPALEMEEQGSS